MRDVDAAWVAGLLEGEGSFGFAGGSGTYKNGSPKIRQIRVTCGMTDVDTIEKLNALTGVGAISHERRLDSRRPRAKPMYVWSVAARLDVVALLEQIRPHMSARRGARIDELLRYADEHPLKYNVRAEHGTVTRFRGGCRCSDCEPMRATYNAAQSEQRRARKAQA